jgi:serine phosphatase RsbU (regulator of sigma subunit)
MQIPYISIRVKILSLIVFSLVVSLATYSYLGSSLIISDKSSYIYDFIYSKVKFVSQSIESDSLRVIHFLEKADLSHETSLKDSFYEFKSYFPITGIQKYKIDKDKNVKLDKKIGDDLKVSEFPWISSDFDRVLFKYQFDVATGAMLIGMKKAQNDFILAQFKLSSSEVLTGAGMYNLLVIDAAEKTKDPSQNSKKDPSQKITEEIESTVKKLKFTSGVKEIRVFGKDFLTGYDQILNGSLIVISLIPKEVAFQAARNLVIKSVILGVGIFLIAVGLALLLVHGLLVKVQELVVGTNRVAAGDFNTPLKLHGKDELTRLAESFNIMSERIKALIIETADKARMSKELETASFVQTTFLPSRPFESSSIKIYGASISASECSGDWWQYAQVQDYVVLVMGDVVGHGVSAALITAMIYSAFFNFVEDLKLSKTLIDQRNQILNPLLNLLNQTIGSAQGAESSFPCIAAVFNLKTKQLWCVNAGHIAPFQFNGKSGEFALLKDSVDLPLGQYQVVHQFDVSEKQLGLDDQLFWFTDGLFDERTVDGIRIKKKTFLQDLGKKLQSSDSSGPAILSQVAL